jgi:DNA-binding response OmpR family regulator
MLVSDNGHPEEAMAGRIVIVEDRELTADRLALYLTDAGYDVAAICASVDQALNTVRDRDPDLVLVDPDIGRDGRGLQVASALSARRTPFIFIADHDDPDMRMRALGTGPSGYLTGPFTPEGVVTAVSSALGSASP